MIGSPVCWWTLHTIATKFTFFWHIEFLRDVVIQMEYARANGTYMDLLSLH